MIFFQNQVLVLREGKEASKKPERVVVGTKDCEGEWLIQLIDGDNSFILPKAVIAKFYEPAQKGRQGELFGKSETRVDRLKKRHLK